MATMNMHPRVEKLPRPDPDYSRFLAAIARKNRERTPQVELAVHPEVVAALLGDEVGGPAEHGSPAAVKQTVRLMYRLGYDVVKVSAGIPLDLAVVTGQDASGLSRSQRSWQDARGGCIATMEDCAIYTWPGRHRIDYSPVSAAIEVLPAGMKLLGFCGGVLEYTTYLMGLERFMLALYDAPELVREVVDRVGEVLYNVFDMYCATEQVAALWLGDDLGSKNGLLVSSAFLRERILPWYRKFAELAHQHDRPFLLHSCGKTNEIMPALVADVGIDAKHSFEDAIQPVEDFIERWGDRVAVMGGVDVNLLALGDEAAIRRRVLQVLERGAPTGGYVCGSGNSIPNYVSPGNYLTMIEVLADFNGQR
jgi:uroporphyrinogen decarboxylase